jgi:hypothetical protein
MPVDPSFLRKGERTRYALNVCWRNAGLFEQALRVTRWPRNGRVTRPMGMMKTGGFLRFCALRDVTRNGRVTRNGPFTTRYVTLRTSIRCVTRNAGNRVTGM